MQREPSKTHQAPSLPRIDRLLEKQGGDTYGQRSKLPDPTACTGCGALYRDGRWSWGAPPADAHRALCPACHRIQDDYPAGLVLIEGDFAVSHGEEITGLVRNVEEREKKEHPLKRVMRIDAREDGGLEIPTTDARLAHGIGEALHHAYQGELDYHFTDKENLLRVHWKR